MIHEFDISSGHAIAIKTASTQQPPQVDITQAEPSATDAQAKMALQLALVRDDLVNDDPAQTDNTPHPSIIQNSLAALSTH